MPKPPPQPVGEFDLERPLLYFSPHDPWRIRDAVEGTQIFGATGSGKSSGSGQALAKAFLRAGFGGLVLTVKPDERALWQRYARETGREKSLVIFAPGKGFGFNFLNYEFLRPGAGAGLTENVVNLFSTVLEIGERRRGKGGGDDQYWKNSVKQLMRNAVELLAIARGKVSLPDLYELVASAPQSPEEVHSEAWQQGSLCHACVNEGHYKQKSPAETRNFEIAARYWFREFPSLVDKTRSVIVSMFTGMADCFIREPLRSLFCGQTNIVPEFTHKGVVAVIDLPVKEYNELGQFAQVIFKYVWQRATERRNVAKNPRPVFLWADEAQYFVTSADAQFQTTARSSRACTVLLSQNISNYYAFLGGERAETDSLLGNLQTKVFHSNGDSVTNLWASELFGKTVQLRRSTNISSGQGSKMFGAPSDRDPQTTAGSSETLEYELLPREFTTLRKGGPENGYGVEGIVFQGGRRWQATGSTHIRVSFDQRD